MKTTLLIQDGYVQIVLTPENSWEKEVVEKFTDNASTAQIQTGSFYKTQIGYTKHGQGDESMIISSPVK